MTASRSSAVANPSTPAAVQASIKRVDELIQQQIKSLDARLRELEQLAPSQILAKAGGKPK